MEDKLERLIKVLENGFPEKEKIIDAVKAGWKMTGFWYKEEKKALYSFFIDNDIQSAKQHFYLCGIVDEFEINELDQPILDYGINHLSYALLSDDPLLINRYASLRHKNYDKTVANGSATTTFILQCLIKDDWASFEKGMTIMQTKTIKRYPVMQWDLHFFEGMAERNKTKIESTLATLVTPKMHMRRNKKQILLNEFISHPALGYAKLAWLKGIEVEVDSPLVPKELLPVKPLGNYVNEYDFLNQIQLDK